MRSMRAILLFIAFAPAVTVAQNLNSVQEGFSFDRKGQMLIVKNPDGQIQRVDLNNPAFKGKAIAFTYSAKKKTVYREPEKIHSSVKVFPNPASGNVNIVLDESWGLPVEMQIWDKYGNTIKTQTLETGNTPVNIASFTQGTYIIRLRAGNSADLHTLVVH